MTSPGHPDKDELERLAGERETLALAGEAHGLGEQLEALRTEILRTRSRAEDVARHLAVARVTARTRSERAKARRRIELQRRELARRPEHALNRIVHLKRLVDRFALDLEAAIERIYCAHAGIAHVLGVPTEEPARAEDLDRLHHMTRALVDWLLVLSRADQVVSIRVDVRAMAIGSWTERLAGDKRIAFRVGPELFEGARAIRLQSVSAWVGPNEDAVRAWRIKLSAPDQKIPLRPLRTLEALRAAGGEFTPETVTVPSVVLGAVPPYSPSTPPDRSSGLALVNVNPIGEWWVEVLGDSRGSSNASALENIIVQLEVVVTPEFSQ